MVGDDLRKADSRGGSGESYNDNHSDGKSAEDNDRKGTSVLSECDPSEDEREEFPLDENVDSWKTNIREWV